MLIRYSNYGNVPFGTDKGKVRQSSQGFRIFNPKTNDIGPLACTSYRNAAVMTGTNDLKKNNLSYGEILDLYKIYKTKFKETRISRKQEFEFTFLYNRWPTGGLQQMAHRWSTTDGLAWISGKNLQEVTRG